MVKNSESGAAENYYMKIRFYDICDKEKVAVCRLKPDEKITANLSIDSYEIIETLPYKPDMEREAFLAYLQSIYNNGLTEEHLVLVRKKNINSATVVTTYRVEVRNWGVKQSYVDFNIETSYYPIGYYLRLIESEYLDGGGDGAKAPAPAPAPAPTTAKKQHPNIKPKKQAKPESKPTATLPVITVNTVSDGLNQIITADAPTDENKTDKPDESKRAIKSNKSKELDSKMFL